MSISPARLFNGIALGAIAAVGTWFLFTTSLSTWPPWTRTLFGWALLVEAMGAIAVLAHGLGILKGDTLHAALAQDRHHVLRQTFIALTLGCYFLYLGVGIYGEPPTDSVNPWRVFVLFIGSFFISGSTRHPQWLYERLRHSGGNELLRDLQSTQLIFAVLGALLSLYALAARGA